MEHPAVFEMRFAAHETQVAKINREGWKVTRDGKVATASRGRQEPQGRVPTGWLAGLVAVIARRARVAGPPAAQVG